MKLYESHSIEYMRLGDLQEDPRNPKAHDDQAIEESIRHFSLIEPFVIDGRTGYLISGHGRKKAMLSICENKGPLPNGASIDDSGAWTVPVVTGWSSKSDAEARAVLIALNRTTELGGWVDETLLGLLDELQEMDDDYPIGFTDEDRETLRRLADAQTFLSSAWDDEEEESGGLDVDDEQLVGDETRPLPDGSPSSPGLPAPPLGRDTDETYGAYKTLIVRVSDEEAYQKVKAFLGPARMSAGKNGAESFWYGTPPEKRTDAEHHTTTMFVEPGQVDDAPSS